MNAESQVGALARRLLPDQLRSWVKKRNLNAWPPVGFTRFGSLRRLQPVSPSFGFDRGTPIDRYYIEHFLHRHGGDSGDIHGDVLEVGDDAYTRLFGGTGSTGGSLGVKQVDILHVDASNPRATIIGDLSKLDDIEDRFDCIICTQTLLLIYEVRLAIRNLARMLKPGGVVLATVPGISRICRPEVDIWGDYWRFTTLSARRAFEEAFPPEGVTVEAYGNVLSAIAFLHGLSAADLKPDELNLRDPDYEVLIAIRAVKKASEPARPDATFRRS